MNKMKKRAIAIATAITMALALVAAVVPATTLEAAGVSELTTNAEALKKGFFSVGTVMDAALFRTAPNVVNLTSN